MWNRGDAYTLNATSLDILLLKYISFNAMKTKLLTKIKALFCMIANIYICDAKSNIARKI